MPTPTLTRKPTLGSEIRSLVHVVQARLNGTPDTSREWYLIASRLRQASDRARKVALLAARMEAVSGPVAMERIRQFCIEHQAQSE